MSKPNPYKPAPLFRPPATPASNTSNLIPSSSPAFATPMHPLRPLSTPKATILPILLPPATLRPLAFRTFTKKHSLTLTSSALQLLATFIGKHCGTGWREEGLAERVLEEVAKGWKNRSGGVIVEGDAELKEILKGVEGGMSGGRVGGREGLKRQDSLGMGSSQFGEVEHTRLGLRPAVGREDSIGSVGLGALQMNEEEGDETGDPRNWLKVVDAFEQPRLIYNVGKKHFDRETTKASLFPPASHKTLLFQNRYNIIHQRLLRNDSFQTPTFRPNASTSSTTPSQSYKLTPIANLLGRNNSTHMLLGLLSISPTGTLTINDLTGSIALDLTHAHSPPDGAWFAPGMIVLVDGTYIEDEMQGSSLLGGNGGVGGTISGRFVGFFIGHPPAERRHVTLGTTGDGDSTAGGGFGWVDFLGVGSERATGTRMRRLEQKLLPPQIRPSSPSSSDDPPPPSRGRIILLGNIHLDIPSTHLALFKILTIYSAEPPGSCPLTFVLFGPFVSHSVLSRGGSGGSIEYKEFFDTLASTLSEFPTLLANSTFVFVPGDNDAWVSAFSAGSATPLPRKGVPEMFTSRVKRAFGVANAEAGKESGGKKDKEKEAGKEKDKEKDAPKKGTGEAIWASNPCRLSLFGVGCEIVCFRDDISGRLRRTAVTLGTPKTEHNEEDEQENNVESEMTGDQDQEDHNMTYPPQSPSQQTEQQISPSNGTDNTPESATLQTARTLTKTLLDQAHLSPFPLSLRPQHWDYATSSLSLYPLPTAVMLCDGDAPEFSITYEGCGFVNAGRMVGMGRRKVARWVEWDVLGRKGEVREVGF